MIRAIGKPWLLGIILSGLLSCPALTQSAPSAEHAKIASAQSTPQSVSPARRFETTHEGVFGGQRLSYKAVVAEHFIIDPSGARTASIFTTSFIRTDISKNDIRPVIFAFNGGPGSASLWLEMGLVGPRRIDFADAVKPETTPPFHIVDNPDSPLDVADIVLIDPPGTGFSRVLPPGKAEEFYGTQQDAQATIDIIEQWLRENDRWNSPRYLIGESYGTIRAAVVARMLAGGPTETGNMDGLTLNGVVLLGQAMDTSGSAGDDGEYLSLLPTLAATACYHGRIAGACTAASEVAAAKRFAADTYLKALYDGSNLPTAARGEIVARLAALTGLSPDFIREKNLRISAPVFTHELLRNQNKQIGMYDGRYTLPLSPNGDDPVADDPAMGQYVPGFVTAFNLYERDELGVSIDETYQAIAFRSVNGSWDYGDGPGKGPHRNYADDLAIAMRRNPDLRLLVGEGYYDLVTPLGSAEYTIAHAGIPSSRTEMRLYPSGHMAYLGNDARQMLARDLREFIGGGSAKRP